MVKRARSRLPLTIPCLLASALALSPPARADTAPADEAASELIFRQATAAYDAGRYDEACQKYAESQRLDPTPGTLLNIGRCEEKRGNLATAYGSYVEAAYLARKTDDKKGREAYATQQSDRLLPLLPMLIVAVPPASRVDGLEIKRNGKTVGAGQWGIGVPMDPGAVALEATAPGRAPWKITVQIEPRPGTIAVTVPALGEAPVAPGAPAASTAAEPTEPAAGWPAQRTAGLVVGGVGIAGLVVGSIFGAKALGKGSASTPYCPSATPDRCTAAGVMLRDDALTFAHVSTASLVLGGAAVAAGTILFLTAPSRRPAKSGDVRWEARPLVGLGGGGLLLNGRW
jgi:hypothetical protein